MASGRMVDMAGQRTGFRGMAAYQTVVHRYEAGSVYRLRDRDRMRRAMEAQDALRQRAKRGGNLTKVIREWRDKRCS